MKIFWKKSFLMLKSEKNMGNINNTVRKTISEPGVILKKIGRARITQGGKSNNHEII